MKHFIMLIAIALTSISARATDYQLILPSTPGSASDIMGRTIQQEFARHSTSRIRLEHKPGGDQIIAVNHFRQNPNDGILLGTSTINVVNPIFKESLPYSSEDFHHVVFIGRQAQVWYVPGSSTIRNLADLDQRLARGGLLVGADALGVQINAMSLKKLHPHGHNVEIVTYKGSPQVLIDVAGGRLDAAVSSISPQITSMAQEGLIRIIATTESQAIDINGSPVPSAGQHWRIPQFGGLWVLSVSHKLANTESGRKLIQELYAMTHSESFRAEMKRQTIVFDGRDGKNTESALDEYRANARRVKP